MSKELPVEIEFRLRAAARVLERAAKRTNDQQLKAQLESLAAALRRAAEGNIDALRELGAASARASTVEEMVEEIRRWLWERHTVSKSVEEMEREAEGRLLSPIRRFERFLDELDRMLEDLERMLG